MRVVFTVGSLETAAHWTSLKKALGDGHPEVVRNTIRHLKLLGAKSYVLEEPYIDRDYSADYLEFYARTFRTHTRHCRRAHFFSKDVSPLVGSSLSTQGLAELRRLATDAYCGFCVLRPLPTAPIGRTVLCVGLRRHQDLDPAVTCRASFDANLLGIDLEVTGAAYLQQDARVGACAQVTDEHKHGFRRRLRALGCGTESLIADIVPLVNLPPSGLSVRQSFVAAS